MNGIPRRECDVCLHLPLVYELFVKLLKKLTELRVVKAKQKKRELNVNFDCQRESVCAKCFGI